jgi:anti-sigma factor RsiW
MSDHVLDRLSAYLDDELEPGERAALATHLSTCPACARQLAELAALDRAARALPAEPPAGYFDDFAGRVRARIRGKAERRSLRLPLFTLAAAAALALAALTPMLLRERPAPAAAPQPARTGEADRVSALASPPAALDQKPVAAPAAAPPATLAPAAAAVGYAQGRAAGGAAPHDEDESRKDAPAAPRLQNQPEAVAKRALAEGFAAAPEQKQELAVTGPVPAAPPPAAMAPQAAPKAREAQAQEAGTLSGALAAERATADAAGVPLGPQARYHALLAKKAGSAAEARALREEWRALSEKALGGEADEARVRAIEAGVVAYGLGHDERDLARLRSDAAAYLERPDAAQAARVRALLRSVDPGAP